MENLTDLQEKIDDLLLNSAEIKNEVFLQKAKMVYEKGIEGRAEGLFFTNYLTFYFKEGGLSLFEKMKPSGQLGTLKPRFSAYEVVKYASAIGLKDIFTRQDFTVKNESSLSEGDILVGSLYQMGAQQFISEDAMIFPIAYKETLVKGMMEKYNEYVTHEEMIDLEGFVEKEPVILMKFIEILNEVEEENYEAHDDYLVYQSVYLVGDPIGFKNLLKQDSDFEISLEESGFIVAKLYADKGTEEENLIAEVVVDGNRIEIESLDDFRQNMAKEKFERTFKDLIAHFKDEVLSMDDLIE